MEGIMANGKWEETPFRDLSEAIAFATSKKMAVEEVPNAPSGFFVVKIAGYLVCQKIGGGPVKQLVPNKPTGQRDRYTGPPLVVDRRLVSGIIHHSESTALADLQKKLARCGNVHWQTITAEVCFVHKGSGTNELYIYWPDDRGGWFSCVVYPPLHRNSPELQPEYFTPKSKILGGE